MWLQGFALLLLGITLSAQASNSYDFSTENYNWREYKDNGFRFLSETGLRYSLGLSSTHYQGSSARHSSIRFYFGGVQYDGYLQDQYGNIVAPYQSTTSYSGFNLEQKRLSYAFANMQGYGEFGYGLDTWQRVLDNGGTHGYTEDYLALYLRAGFGFGRSDEGWHTDIGIKYPLMVSEVVNTDSYDPIHLSPQPQLSAYAEVGYADRGWGLVLYYDSYNFAASPIVPITYFGIYTGYGANQPNSVTDRLGLRLSIYY